MHWRKKNVSAIEKLRDRKRLWEKQEGEYEYEQRRGKNFKLNVVLAVLKPTVDYTKRVNIWLICSFSRPSTRKVNLVTLEALVNSPVWRAKPSAAGILNNSYQGCYTKRSGYPALEITHYLVQTIIISNLSLFSNVFDHFFSMDTVG